MYDLNDVPIYDLNMFRRYKTSNVYQQIVRSRWFWDSSIWSFSKFYAISKNEFWKISGTIWCKEKLTGPIFGPTLFAVYLGLKFFGWAAMKNFNDGAIVGWGLALNQIVFDRDNFKSTFSTFPSPYLCEFPTLVNTMSWWVLFKSKSYLYFLTNMLNFILSRTDWWPCTNCSFNWPNLVMQIISWAYYGQLPRMVNRMYETDVGVTSSIDFRPAFIDFGYFVA